MDQLSIGIVGYGEFAEFCHKAWKTLGDVRVSAAADLNVDRIPADLAAYGDWKELIQDPDVDIVAIGTPPSTHSAIAIAALEAGKNVFVEKPPAMTAQDANRLLEAVESTGKICSVDYMLRYNPIVEALKAIGDSGVLGKLQHVSVSNYAYDGKLPPEHWFWDKAKSGGILVEHAVHFFDVVTFVSSGKPVRMTAHGVSRQPGMEDKVAATVEYDDGLIATHYHHFFRPWWFERQTFRFAYDMGEVDVEGWIPTTAKLRAVTTEGGASTLRNIFPSADVTEEPLDLKQIAGDITYSHDASTIVGEISAGGSSYRGDRMLHLAYGADKSKIDIYEDCVRASMRDLAECVRNPGRLPRTAIQNSIDSIRVAAVGAQIIDEKRCMEI